MLEVRGAVMALPCELYFLRSYTFILSCAREEKRLEVRRRPAF